MTATKQQGMAVVEVAIVVPILLLLMLALVQFGQLMHNYLLTADAAGIAGQFFLTRAGSETAYQDTIDVVEAVAPHLEFELTTLVNGTECTDATSPTCGEALTQGAGGRAVVTVTYHIEALFNISLPGLPGWPDNFSNSVAYRVTQ